MSTTRLAVQIKVTDLISVISIGYRDLLYMQVLEKEREGLILLEADSGVVIAMHRVVLGH
jgi:hypothetical protein